MSIGAFFGTASGNPALIISVILTIGVIFVNGWTDAPNAIATSVATRCMPVRAAVIMSAIFNFLGITAVSALNQRVAATVKNMVNFGQDRNSAAAALCAALFAVILWAVSAWAFGIPTSESHALIAGLSGAAIALNGNINGINYSEWQKVLLGLFISTTAGATAGFFCSKAFKAAFKNASRKSSVCFFKYAQIFGSASMSFMHGAQDGQKFMGVLWLCIMLTNKSSAQFEVSLPICMMLLCSLTMAAGTSLGGYKIIKSVGVDMVKLEPYEGFSADIAGAFSLAVCSAFGFPVSTTHTKTTAIMGVGAAKRFSAVNYNIIKNMALAWVFTFPSCGIIGYSLAKIFAVVF